MSDEQRKVSEIVFRSDLYPRIASDPLTVQKYAESLEWRGRVAFCFGTPIGMLSAGKFIATDRFCISVAEHYFETERANYEVTEREKSVQERLAQRLRSEGWSVSKEQYTSQGRIDILAQKDGEARIIEVKLSVSSNDAAHALGQLLFYSKFHPGASLWLASPEQPDDTVLSILNSFAVRFMEA